MDLENKIGIVTGAAQGMGKAIVLKMIAEGATVIATDVQEIKYTQDNSIARSLDVSSESEWSQLVSWVMNEYGRIDLLVNNAGILQHTELIDIEMEQWNKIVSINQTGVMLGMRGVIPQMIKNGSGAIVNFSSTGGIRSLAPDVAAYNATKAAVRLLTKSAATAYGKDNIRVNAVLPGLIETAMTKDQDEINKPAIANAPLRRAGKPEEVAESVVFLLSEKSSFITGVDLVVDGGLSIQ